MGKWFDLHEKRPQISGEYQVMLKGIDGQPDEEATAHCEVMFCGTVCRWTIHGVYQDSVVCWKSLDRVFPSEWIPTTSEMPDRGQNVLVWLYGNYDIGYLDKDPDTRELRWHFEEFNLYGDEMEAVEAWMPLPKAYNGEWK